MIRPVAFSDCEQIASIYNYYIENTTVTFEEESISAYDIERRIRKIPPNLPWLVFVDENEILGYAYATPWRTRSAYRFSVEISVYVKIDSHGNGIGTELYTDLMSRLNSIEIHTIIGGITLPNDASIKLHEKMGFKKIAEFEEVGFKFGQWLNVGYWQLTNA